MNQQNNSIKFLAAIVLIPVLAAAYYFVYYLPVQQNEKIKQGDQALEQERSVNLTVTVLPTYDGSTGLGMYKDKYPTDINVSGLSAVIDQISPYGAAYQTWIGPKGWVGKGELGADGNVVVDLYPPGGSSSSGPHISYYEVPACLFCRLAGAAPYFPNAMQQYNAEENQDGTNPIKVPQGLKVTTISSTLATYTLPTTNGLSTHGVAYYDPDNQLTHIPYAQAEFVLPAGQTDLSNFLLQTFINREGSKNF